MPGQCQTQGPWDEQAISALQGCLPSRNGALNPAIHHSMRTVGRTQRLGWQGARKEALQPHSDVQENYPEEGVWELDLGDCMQSWQV